MGLFKKKERPQIMCECCGDNITFGTELAYNNDVFNKLVAASDAEFESAINRYRKASELAGRETGDFGLFNTAFGGKKLCGYCFSKLLYSITEEEMSALDFLRIDRFKIDYINNLITDMSISDIKERVRQYNEAALKEAEKAEEEAKAELEAAKKAWVDSLK